VRNRAPTVDPVQSGHSAWTKWSNWGITPLLAQDGMEYKFLNVPRRDTSGKIIG
jgi:hypothetical protein